MKKSLLFVVLILLIVSSFGIFGIAASADTVALTETYLLNEENWTNLPGYEYVSPDVKDENGTKYPAEVAFSEDANGTGINMKVKGYYQALSGDEYGNEYAGIVLNEKISVKDFSITLTINKLGASSSASPADDGWIGIGLMSRQNLWHTANTNVNSGMVALLRTANRSVNVVAHEIASDGAGYKVANFVGTPTPPSANLDLAPATEGATLRFSIVTKEENSKVSYFVKIEQLDFKTGEVISSRTSNLSLICPELYIDSEGKAYLAISCSTDNFDKDWDISIKNICGVDVGRAEDAEPISPTQRAQNIYELIEQLKIYEYFDVEGNMSDEAKAFYLPNGEIDVNALATDFAIQLYNADNEVIAKLTALDAVYSLFENEEAYLAFLNTCTDAILENYESVRADQMIEKLNTAIAAMPHSDSVTLATEKETFAGLQNIKDIYFSLSETAIEKLGARYDAILNDVILVYEEKLEAVSVEKYLALAMELPNEITMDNAKQAVFALVPAESIYESIEKMLEDMQNSDVQQYNAIMQAKVAFDGARAAVDALKATNVRDIEAYENGAKVRNGIFYLPNPVSANHAEEVFALLVNYLDLRSDISAEITEEEKQALITASKSALESVIAELPLPEAMTAENYITLGYDISVNTANNYFNVLENADSDIVESVVGQEKLRSLVSKLSVLTTPLSAIKVVGQTVKAGETLTLSFGDMFNNFFGLDYTVTANCGNVDKELEFFTVSFDKAGEYTVEVTMTDNVYGQSSVCSFTVKVEGAAEKSGGCGSSLGYGTAISILGIAILMCIKRRKECR